jgi:hypothetical protein
MVDSGAMTPVCGLGRKQTPQSVIKIPQHLGTLADAAIKKITGATHDGTKFGFVGFVFYG